MSFDYKSTQQVLYVQLNNFPRNVCTGYGQLNGGGKVYLPDGSLIMYLAVDMEYITDPESQITANHSLTFGEMPCDSAGNNLLKGYWFSTVDGYMSSEKIYVMLHMAKEPSHRVNLTTGVLTDDNHDNNYLRKVVLSYMIAEKP